MASLGSYAVFTDADLATPAEEIGKLLHVAETTSSNVVIGSRRAIGADVKREQVWYRNLLGRLANKLIQTLLLPGILDTQCGCKLFSRKAVQDIFPQITTGGWGFDIEVLARAKKLGYAVTEVGVRWHDVAESKVGGGAYISTLKDLISIWMNVK
jgi:dolichyl-phosphate beta-glucosyltransferase